MSKKPWRGVSGRRDEFGGTSAAAPVSRARLRRVRILGVLGGLSCGFSRLRAVLCYIRPRGVLNRCASAERGSLAPSDHLASQLAVNAAPSPSRGGAYSALSNDRRPTGPWKTPSRAPVPRRVSAPHRRVGVAVQPLWRLVAASVRHVDVHAVAEPLEPHQARAALIVHSFC